MSASLKDADDMFYNRDSDVKTSNGIDGKRALYAWWSCFKGHGSGTEEAGKSENFKQAAFLNDVVKKG